MPLVHHERVTIIHRGSESWSRENILHRIHREEGQGACWWTGGAKFGGHRRSETVIVVFQLVKLNEYGNEDIERILSYRAVHQLSREPRQSRPQNQCPRPVLPTHSRR